MVGKWLVVLPLLVDLNHVTLHPITEEDTARRVRQLDQRECCPCPDSDRSFTSVRTHESSFSPRGNCPCLSEDDDTDASASILRPALRAFQPQTAQKTEPKPLLQPEVGLASSVLETLKEATDEEYQDALARDAARSAVNLIESDLSVLGDTLTETPKKIVRIFLNPKDDMDDNLPEPSHIQETRCIHSPLGSTHNMGQLRLNRPSPIIEVIDIPRRPMKKLKSKSLLHRNHDDMDSSIGASNIQERILQHDDDTLKGDTNWKTNADKTGLLLHNSMKKSDFLFKGPDKIMDAESGLINKVVKSNSKANLKLRELIDNLEITSNKDKLKLPVIDLKKYFATSTRLPPLKFKPIENPLFRTHKPLQLKDLLKLKDVEIIPRNDIRSNAIHEDDSNLKSQHNDCGDDNANSASGMNSMTATISKPVISEPTDTITSPTDFNSMVIKKNHEIFNNKNDEFNSNLESTVVKPVDARNKNFFDKINIQSKQEPTSEELLQNDSNISSDPKMECLSTNNKSNKQKFENSALKKNDLVDIDGDILNEKSNNTEYQIELVEDFNLPIVFDNTSLTELNTNDAEDIHNTKSIKANQNVIDDTIAETSNNNLNIMTQMNENPEELQNNEAFDCNSDENLSQTSQQILDKSDENLLTHMPHNIESSEDLSNMEDPVKSIDINSRGSFSDLNNGSNQISYQDLQNMSDSILSLSKCEPYTEEEKDTSIENNLNKALKKVQTDSFEESNSEMPPRAMLEEKKSNEIKMEDNFNSANNLMLNGFTEQSEQGFNENLCGVPITIDNGNTEEGSNDLVNNLNKGHSEMVAEASEHDSSLISNLKSAEPKDGLLRNIETESVTGNNILEGNKQINILNSLKSRLDNLFSPSKNVPKNKAFSSTEDTVNESSNIKPVITHFEESHMPLMLREASLPKIPGTTLTSYKNRLAVPKSLDRAINLEPALNNHIGLIGRPNPRQKSQNEEGYTDKKLKQAQTLRRPLQNFIDKDTLRPNLLTNAHDIFPSPLELPKPFEDIMDRSALSLLSDKLRSHAENSIQNMKEAFDSRLRESQISGLSKPSTVDTQDILETITSRRDELNEKLKAIHSDINDRFSTFHQSVLDRISEPLKKNNEQDGDSSNGFKTIFNPLQSVRPEAPFKPIGQNVVPQITTHQGKEITERFLKSPKINNAQSFRYTESSNSEARAKNKSPGIFLEKNNLPSLKQVTPKVNHNDRKTSLRKLTTSTIKPSLIPRPKAFKTKIDIAPAPTTDSESIKTKPLFTKPRTRLLTEEPAKSPSHILPSRISPQTPQKASREEISSDEDSSTDSPLDKLRKTLLQRNNKMKYRNNIKNTSGNMNLLNNPLNIENNFDRQNGLLGRLEADRIRQGSRRPVEVLPKNNDGRQSHIDATHSAAQNLESIKMVEPLQENVPYKCKLICYKDV